MRIQPGAFISYAHLDDAETNKVTTWYRSVAFKISQLTNANFPVHCDRDFIGPGQDWAREILVHLQRSMFLLPIVSPAYFASDYCRFEVDQFLNLERRRGRDDLIVPFLLADTPQLADPDRAGDALVAMVRKRQFVDLRSLRGMTTDNEAFTTLVDRVAVSLAATVRRVLAAGGMTQSGTEPGPVQRIVDAGTPVGVEGGEEVAAGPTASLAAAIAAAQSGDRIVLRPGVYRGPVVVDRPLELVGDGNADDVVIEGRDADTLVFDAAQGRIANLTVRQLASDDGAGHAVVIRSGRPVVEGCRISSHSLSCVSVGGHADPVIRRCRVEDGMQFGLLFHGEATGTIENCEIAGHRIAAVKVMDKAVPRLRRNRIGRGATFAIAVRGDGGGVFEDNDIADCDNVLVVVSDDARPTLRGNRIRDGRNFGVAVEGRAAPLLDGNEIAANANCGVVVQEQSKPTLRANKVRDNRNFGVSIGGESRPVLEGNEVAANANCGVIVHDLAGAALRANRIHDNRNYGIAVQGPVEALIEENTLARNRYGELLVDQGANPTVRGNRIDDSTNYAISIRQGSSGVFEGNTIRGSAEAGINVEGASRPLVRSNTIADGHGFGLSVTDGGAGVFEDNAILRSAGFGVWIEGAAPTLRRNRIRDGRSFGVCVLRQGGGTVEDNEITGQAESGVLLDPTAAVALLRNRIVGNAGYGIQVESPCVAVIEDNDLRGNGAGAWVPGEPVRAPGRAQGNRVDEGGAAPDARTVEPRAGAGEAPESAGPPRTIA